MRSLTLLASFIPALTALALTAPAVAGGLAQVIPPPEPPRAAPKVTLGWAGATLGVGLGQSRSRLGSENPPQPEPPLESPDPDFSDLPSISPSVAPFMLEPMAVQSMTSLSGSETGISFSLRAGYNWQVSRLVIGVLGEYATGLGSWQATTDAGAREVEQGAEARLSLRLGFDAGRWMPYLIAGQSWSELSLADEKTSVSGTSYGIGAAYRLNAQWSLFGELTETKYDDVSFGAFTTPTNVSLTSERLSLGLDYRF